MAAIGLACLLLYWYPTEFPMSEFVHDLYANLATSLLSISITVLLIDRIYEQRDRNQLRKRLIWEMGSSDQASASRAVKELRDAGWLLDGSLASVDLTLANLGTVSLTDAHLKGVNLTSTNLTNANLVGALLDGAVLDECTAESANFKGASLIGASMRRCKLRNARFDDSDLSGDIDMLGASLIKTSLRGAKLPGARLEECDLLDCDMSSADLTGAVFLRANVDGALFEGTNLERADLQELSNWEKIRNINGARVSGLRNSPEGFKAWALANGAIE